MLGNIAHTGQPVTSNAIAHIDIGSVFSKVLGPRTRSAGEWSGEDFRERFLEPALRDHATVVIQLDSIIGYTASFFEEAFGGLVRKHGFENVARKIRFESQARPYLIDMILRWMREASEKT